MRKLLILFCLAAPAWGGIVRKQSLNHAANTSANGQAIVISSADAAVGVTIVVSCEWIANVSLTSMSDTVNSYTPDKAGGVGTNASVQIYHSTNVVAAGTYTPTCNYGSSAYGVITVSEYTGFAGEPALDQSNSGAGHSYPTLSGGTITVNGTTWNSTWTVGSQTAYWAVVIVGYKALAGNDLVISVYGFYYGTSTPTAPTNMAIQTYNYGSDLDSALADNSASLATDFTCTGPSSGYNLQTSTNFTCSKTTGSWSGGNTVTISDGSHGGLITSGANSGTSTLTVTPGAVSSFTFTYTPASVATITISFADNYSQIPSGTDVYTVSALTLTLSGSGCTSSPGGYVTLASASCTVTLGGGSFNSAVQAMTVTLADNASTAGTFTPSVGSAGASPLAVTVASGTAFTFTYTPAVGGSPLAISISLSNNFSGTNPSPYTYNSNLATLAFSGCATGTVGTLETCTVSITGLTYDGIYTLTISDNRKLGTLACGASNCTLVSSSPDQIVARPTNGASSFTINYTPALVGNVVITGSHSNPYWAAPSPLSDAVTSSDICNFAAKANGNWNSASTWTPSGCTGGGHAYPVTGDNLTTTGYHVICPTGVTCVVGSCPANNTTYDLTVAPSGGNSGWVELQGGSTLVYCGNIKLNAPANATPTSFAIFQLDTGALLNWDMNNGSTAYRLVPGATGGWNNLVIGTLGDTCNFASETCPTNVLPVNIGTAKPVLVDVNSTTDSMTYQIYGTLLKNCGSATVGCLNYATDGTTGRNSYANAGLVDIEQSVWDTTGNFQAHDGTGTQNWGVVLSLTFKENRFLNDLAGMLTLTTAGGWGSAPKGCTLLDNYFSGIVGESNGPLAGCSITGNIVVNGMSFANATATALSVFSGNASLVQGNNQSLDSTNPIFGNYFAFQSCTGSIHGYEIPGDQNQTYSGNVHEALCSAGESHCIVGSGGSASVKTISLDNVSAMAAGNQANSCSIGGQISAGSGGGPSPLTYTDHNGAFGPAGEYQWFAIDAHTTYWSTTASAIRSLRSNIGYSPTTNSANLMVGPNAPDPTAIHGVPNTMAYVPNENWNVLYNAYTGATDWGPSNGNSGCNSYGAGSNASAAYGTAYDQCSTTTPGSGDITADPKLLGLNPVTKMPTRGILQWASTLHGQPGTIAGAQAALIGCPNLGWCVTELVNWVRRGYQPTNVALKGKAYDGRIVGFTGTAGSGYTGGSCTATVTPQDTDDLGYGAVIGCTLVSGVPTLQITNPGMHYRIATPAAVAITGTCTGACVPASLTPVISPHDPGPVPMAEIARVE